MGNLGMVDPKLGSDAHNQLHYDVIAELLIINKPAVILWMFVNLPFRAPTISLTDRLLHTVSMRPMCAFSQNPRDYREGRRRLQSQHLLQVENFFAAV